MINSEKWIGTLTSKKKFNQPESAADPQIWINTVPKKNSHGIFRKHFFMTSFFVMGLILVTIVKNETRNLEKKLNNLKASVSTLKFDIHYAVLDHEVISSPENISNLANKYLDLNLITYKKSQIKNLEAIHKEKSIVINVKHKENIKKHLTKKIIEKKDKIKSLQQIYSKPEEIPKYIKKGITKKIGTTKTKIEETYSDPKKLIISAKAQRWATIQVVKVFLGIPVIPGK